MSITTTTPTNPEQQTTTGLLRDQLDLAHAALGNAIIATLINAVLLCIVLWPVIDHTTLVLWFVGITSVSLLRLLGYARYRSASKQTLELNRWKNLFLGGSLLASLLWASASIWLFPQQDLARQVFLAFVIGGMAAGAVTSLAAIRSAIYSYLLISLIPLIVQFLFHRAELGVEMGIMLSLYLLMMLLAAKRNHENLRQNILLRSDNDGQRRELLEHEQQYRTLLETATDAFFLHDTDGNFLNVNQQACDSLGYTKDELLEMTVFDIVCDTEPEAIKQQWNQLSAGEKLRLESHYRHKDGSTFPVSVSIGLIEMQGQPLVSVLARDISERKQSENEILLSKQQAEKANHAKSEFLSRMSHELRTPMNAILGFGQLLLMDKENLNDTQVGNLREIQKASKHLLDLINEVLDLSKIESGAISMSLEPVNLDDVLLRTIPLIAHQAEERQISLNDNISGKQSVILADFTRIKQVLLNLLSNAVKYNRDGGSIALDSEIIDQSRLRLSIRDSGLGISESNLPKLFIPFDRLDAGRDIEGTGIGLVITRHLVEHMGGSIEVESEENVGSTFIVELPLAEADQGQ